MARRGTPSVHVISMTPFDIDGNVDYGMARAHFQRLKEAGVGVYVAGGGSGEGHVLELEEVAKLLEVAVDELKGHVPVRLMGVEPRSAKQMVALIRLAQDAGVDAAQIYSLDMGHLGKPGNEEMETYYGEVLEACGDLPSVISSHFSVGYLIPIELIARFAADYPIVGVNISTPDFMYMTRSLVELPPHLEVHVGGPMQTMACLAMGGTGYLSSEGNLVPKLVQSVITHYNAGDYPAAEEAYTKVNRLFTMMMGGGDMKAIFRKLGLPGGYPRKPRLTKTNEEGLQLAIKRLLEFGLPELEPLLQAAAT